MALFSHSLTPIIPAFAGKGGGAQLRSLPPFPVGSQINISDRLDRRILKAFFSQGMDHLISIIGIAELVRVDKTIHTTVFHIDHVTLRVKNRFPLDHHSKTLKESMGLIDHGKLFPKSLIHSGKYLGSATNHPAVLPVLSRYLQHLLRQLVLTRHKPVLYLINANNHTLFIIGVSKQLLPLFQLIIFRCQAKICNCL